MLNTRQVVVIEAPGKVGTLRAILKALRISADVVATFGSLYDLPKSALGLNAETLTPTGWRVVNPKVMSRLVEAVNPASKVWIFTDGDRDGELIASQVAVAIRDHCPDFKGELSRIVSWSMTKDVVREAFAAPREIDRRLCLQALTRRGVDRTIGFLGSNQNIADNVAGRISAALVQSVASEPLLNQVLKGRHPDKLNWRIQASGDRSQVSTLAALQEAFVKGEPELFRHSKTGRSVLPAPPPLTGAEGILLISSHLDIAVSAAEKVIQQAYENGDLSYPRTDARRHSSQTQAKLRGYMRHHNTRSYPDDRTWESSKGAQLAHESLHILSSGVHLQASLEGLSRYDAALSLIARRSCAALAPDARIERTFIPQGAIDAFCDSRGLTRVKASIWKDDPEFSGWMALERDLIEPVALRKLPDDRALLARIISQEIGRPSTIVGHITKVMARGWVEDGILTDRGQREHAFLVSELPNLLKGVDLDEYLEKTESAGLSESIAGALLHLGFDIEKLKGLAQKFVRQADWLAQAEESLEAEADYAAP